MTTQRRFQGATHFLLLQSYVRKYGSLGSFFLTTKFFFLKPRIYIQIISYFNNHYSMFLESISFWWICQKPSLHKSLELDLVTKNLCLTQTRAKKRGANKTRVPFLKKDGEFFQFKASLKCKVIFFFLYKKSDSLFLWNAEKIRF